MLNKVVITTDTGSDLSIELTEKYHIAEMIPIYINMGDKSLKDYFECKPDDIFKYKEETNCVPKTSAPPPSDYCDVFEKYASQGLDIVHISINSLFSCSYANSLIAADEISKKYGVKILCVDSRTLTGSQGLLAIRAAELADAGDSAETIAEKITALREKNQTDFLLGGVEYAAKGGRCPMLVAFGANLLKLMPTMHINSEGILTTGKKFRGPVRSAHSQYADYMLEIADKSADFSRIFVNYTGMEQSLLDALVKKVTDYGKFEDVIVARTNCTVVTHGGPNTIALFFLNK